MMFPNDKNDMRVKPLLVSKEAAQRSGRLPTLIVQMVLSATTEHTDASGVAIEEVAS